MGKKKTIGLTDIAKGRASPEESGPLIAEIIENHLPESEWDLWIALKALVFNLVYNHKNEHEIRQWYSIVKGTAVLLERSRDYRETSIRLFVLVSFLEQIIQTYESEKTRSGPIYQSLDWLRFLEEKLPPDAFKTLESSILFQKFDLIHTRISQALDRALPAKDLLDGQAKLRISIQKEEGKPEFNISAQWENTEEKVAPIDLGRLVPETMADLVLSEEIKSLLSAKIIEDLWQGSFVPGGFSCLTKGPGTTILTSSYKSPQFD